MSIKSITNHIQMREEIIDKVYTVFTQVDKILPNLKLTNEKSNNQQCNKLLLCLSQLKKMLSLLNRNDKLPSGAEKKISNYILNCIDQCIKETGKILMNDLNTTNDNYDLEENDEETERLGRFINKLDIVVHNLVVLSQTIKDGNVSVSDNIEWRPLIDDLLFQAVTVSKISGGVDSEEITATCHKILMECKIIESNDATSESFGSFKIHYEILGDALMQLERRVSSALLRLVLKVFSDVHLPLKHLINVINKKEVANKCRTVNDLDKLIEEFDYHNECIQHLFMFALAFSDDKKCVLDVNCCLASLESLETCLVPAIVDLYLDHKNNDKLYYLKFLVDHWLSEVSNLESLLDKIIDPVAFTTVTLQSVRYNIERAKVIAENINKNRNMDLKSDSFYGILNNIVMEAKRLSRHLKHCDNDDVIATVKRLKSVTNECSCALRTLSVINNGGNKEIIISKIFKYFEYLLSVINEILCCLSSAGVSFSQCDKNCNNDSCFQNTTSLLNHLEVSNSVTDLPNGAVSNTNDDLIQNRKIGRGDFFQKIYFANLHKKKRFGTPAQKIDKSFEDSFKDSEDEGAYDVETYVGKLKLQPTIFVNTLYEPSPRKIKSNFNKMTPLTISNLLEDASSLALDITDVLENLDLESSKYKNDTFSTIDDLPLSSIKSTTITTPPSTPTSIFTTTSDLSKVSKLSSRLIQMNSTETIMADLKFIEDKISVLKQL